MNAAPRAAAALPHPLAGVCDEHRVLCRTLARLQTQFTHELGTLHARIESLTALLQDRDAEIMALRAQRNAGVSRMARTAPAPADAPKRLTSRSATFSRGV